MAVDLKIDKETLKKHRFWFLLPVIAICLLVGWICVLYVRGEAEENQKKADAVQKQLIAVTRDPDLRNDAWVAAEREKKGESQSQKDLIWRQNFDFQNGVQREEPKAAAPGQPAPVPKALAMREPLLYWPAETVAEWNKNNPGRAGLEKRDFGENLGIIPNDYKDHFRMHLERIIDQLPWLDERKEEGAVRMLEGAGPNHRERALALVSIADLKVNNKDVESLEAWTLLEDLAIRRELLKSLSGVISNYALMRDEWRSVAPPTPAKAASVDPAKPAPTKPAAEEKGTVVDRASFYNYVWPTGLIAAAPPAGADPAKPAPPPTPPTPPSVEPWQGWLLDLRLDVQDKKRLVRGTKSNYSPKLAIPPAKVVVHFIDAQTGNEMAKTLELADAGDLAPAQPGDGMLSVPTVKELKEQEAPAGALRISRVVRKFDGDWTDAAAVFNQNWLLEVKLKNAPGTSITQVVYTLHNRGPRRMPVPYFILNWSEDAVRKPAAKDQRFPEEKIRFPVDALDSGARKEMTVEIRRPQPPVRVVALHEQMDWRTTPIKRIDKIAIGAGAHEHADRTKIVPLVNFDFASKDYKSPAAAPAAGAPAAPAGAGPMESVNHKVVLKKYIEVSKEVRRLPVALVLVVDASNVNDVLTAMSNSRLSFQVTQAVLNRIPSLGPPAGAVADSGSSAAADSGASQPRTSGGGSSMTLPSAPQMPGGTNPNRGLGFGAPLGDAPRAAMPVGVVDDSSVVVLQIYGMVTLYESPDALERIAAERAANAKMAAAPGQ